MENKTGKSNTRLILLFILLLVLVVAFLYDESPLYFRTLYKDNGGVTKTVSNLSSTSSVKKQSLNESIRKSVKDTGSISFMYNYIPAERAWDTMYIYTIYRYSSTGDYTFYCVRNSIDGGSEDLCECLYSESVWNELLSLILDHEELEDCTSVYDSTGKVVDTPIAKTISIGGGVYCPSNIDDIEECFKKLAVNAGVERIELDKNLTH